MLKFTGEVQHHIMHLERNRPRVNKSNRKLSGQCPSDTCWEWNNTEKRCDLKTTGCDYSVSCAADAFTIQFPHALYASSDSSDFENPDGITDNSCDPTWDAGTSKFQWSKALGECGQTVTRENDKIKIRKVLILGEH